MKYAKKSFYRIYPIRLLDYVDFITTQFSQYLNSDAYYNFIFFVSYISVLYFLQSLPIQSLLL